MTKPLLDLDTLIVRPTIAIDGTKYEMLSPDELSVLDSRRFGIWMKRIQELQEAEEDSPEIDELAEQFATKALVGVPEDVLAKLSGAHRIAVIEVFTGLLLRRRMSVAGATGTAMGMKDGTNPWTGAMFSPGSSGSTAEPRGSGWRKRLSRLFGLT